VVKLCSLKISFADLLCNLAAFRMRFKMPPMGPLEAINEADERL